MVRREQRFCARKGKATLKGKKADNKGRGKEKGWNGKDTLKGKASTVVEGHPWGKGGAAWESWGIDENNKGRGKGKGWNGKDMVKGKASTVVEDAFFGAGAGAWMCTAENKAPPQQQAYVQAMQHAPPWPSASSSAGWQGSTIVLVQPPAQPPWHWSTTASW